MLTTMQPCPIGAEAKVFGATEKRPAVQVTQSGGRRGGGGQGGSSQPPAVGMKIKAKPYPGGRKMTVWHSAKS